MLNETFPDAKFIYTVRDDMEAWLNSSANQWIKKSKQGWKAKTYTASHFMEIYGTIDYDREMFREAYISHDIAIREYFKDASDDKFMIWDITKGEGWDKLCPFLGVDVPTRPFPHQNKSIKLK